MNFKFMWPEPERFIRGQHFSCMEYDSGDDRCSGLHGQPEGSVVKFFQWFIGPVPGAFGVDAHHLARLRTET